MKKLFDSFILRKAADIEKKREENLKLERILNDNLIIPDDVVKIKELANELKDEIIACMVSPMFKVDQEIYVNVFREKYESIGWDGGPNQLIRNMTVSEKSKMPTVKVKKITVHTMWYYELVDTFIQNYATHKHINKLTFTCEFTAFVKRSITHTTVRENLGLYHEIFFEPLTFAFSPLWGLYENSFLSKADGKVTKVVWEQKQSLELQRKSLLDQLDQIDQTIKNLKC